MALIICPECGKKVSDRAEVCPSCGYPISGYAKEKQIQNATEKLLKKILSTDFSCPAERVKVCIKCGSIFYPNNEPGCKCGFPGIEVDYPIQQRSGLETWLYIWNHDVVPRNIGDQDSPEYIENAQSIAEAISSGTEEWPPNPKYFGLPANKHSRFSEAAYELVKGSSFAAFCEAPDYELDEDTARRKAEATAEMIELMDAPIPSQLKPVCPICGSTSLTKITVGKKAVKIGILGVFGMGDAGKTWKCNNCGSKF